MSKPFYQQLKEIIQEMIEDGTFSPGKELPSERDLAERYGANPYTARAAMRILEKDGFLQVIPRRGAFVNLRHPLEPSREQGFTLPEEKKKKQKQTKIFLRKAGPYYSKILQINPDDDIYYLKRIVRDEKPLYLEEVFVPVQIAPDFPNLHPEIFSVEEILAQNSVFTEHTSQLLKICDVSIEGRKKLKLPEGSVVLLLERTDYEKEGPVAFTKYEMQVENLAIEVKFKRYTDEVIGSELNADVQE